MKSLKTALLAVILAVFARADIVLTPETTVNMAMHMHTHYSHGCTYSPEEIVARAKAKGLDAVVFTDHDFIRVSYGISPLKNLLKAGVDFRSVFSEGVDRYYSELALVREKYPEMTVLAGVETSPFYFFDSRNHTLLLNDWQKHLLVFNLNEKDMKALPVLENRTIWKFKTFLLWPFILFLIGALFLNYILLRKPGIILMIISAVFIVNNFPFTVPEFDQYHGFKGSAPYQKVIDYVTEKGGLVVWAHPEAGSNLDFPVVSFAEGRFFKAGLVLSTPPYPDVIENTSGYSGFSILEEGYKEIGKKGGSWDRMLFEYASGRRSDPVFAYGETDYRKEGEGIALDGVRNVVNAKKGDEKALVSALKKGEFYVLKKGRTEAVPVLNEFSSKGQINVAMSDGSKKNVVIKLIKDGFVREVFEGRTPLQKSFKIQRPDRGLCYYRLEVMTEEGSLILSNPLFFKPVSAEEKP